MTSEIDKYGPESIRFHFHAGLVAIALLAGGVGGWAMVTNLASAVIAQGQLVVETNDKKVQHPTGGIVGELRVREGARVRENDVLIRLDDTQTKANLAIIAKSIDEMLARQARDDAELNDSELITFPEYLTSRISSPDVAKIIEGERKLFEIRRTARDGQKSQLRERISQLENEIQGVVTQQEARLNQIDWIKKELEGVNELWKKNLVAYSRITTLERDAAKLEGEKGQLTASVAQAKGKISEINLQIIQIDQDMRAEIGKDLGEIRAKISELMEKKIAAEDQLKRIEIRSPLDGVVHQLNVHTVGGVIGPGEPIMYIVPASEALIVEARIQPQDIDQIHVGEQAILRFSAFNQRTTPQLTGVVTRVSPDVSQDQKTGQNYYTVRISIAQDELSRLENLKLLPGMPVEAFIQMGERNMMSYLLKPLSDQFMRTFRER